MSFLYFFGCKKDNEEAIPWEISSSISVATNIGSYTCNNKYVIFSNSNRDSLFVLDILKKKVIVSQKFTTIGYLVAKEKVLIIPLDEYSFAAYDISDIKNWVHISDFTGLDKGILYWQLFSSPLSDDNYYWIGHWNQTVQIFTINGNTIVKHNKFNVGVNSQAVGKYENYLYVGSNYSANKRYDITDPDNPVYSSTFGNSNSNTITSSKTGILMQNMNGMWTGYPETSDIRLYDQDNNLLDEISGKSSYGLDENFLLPGGFCVINDAGVYKVYNCENGIFEYVMDLPVYSRIYNEKFIITSDGSTFNFVTIDNR